MPQAWPSAGRLTALVDANGNRTQWAYDNQGRMTTVSAAVLPGATFTYTVDNHDRRTRVDLADGGRWEYT